jgi:hypothetical protein
VNLEEKKKETMLRRKAARMGMMLKKSRRRDPEIHDFGLYALIDPKTNCLITPSLYERYASR